MFSGIVEECATVVAIEHELELILDGPARQQMLEGYEEVWQRLGKEKAPDNAARLITQILRERL